MSKFINFFPVKAESSYFSNFMMRARPRTRARAPIPLRMLKIYWKSQNRRIFRKTDFVRACIIKFEKYELSAFTGKKLLNLDKNSRFWRKSKFVNSNFFEAFSKNDMSTQNANKICIKMTKLFFKNSWSFHEFSK